MRKILRYMRPYALHIIAVFLLVIVESLAELAIPECVGNMMSKGFEQYGIDNYIPLVINEEFKSEILSLTDEKEKNLFLSSYEKLTDENQVKTRKKLSELNLEPDGNIYIITELDEPSAKALEDLMFKSLVILGSDNNKDLKEMLIQNTDLDGKGPIIEELKDPGGEEKKHIINTLKNNISKIAGLTDNLSEEVAIKKIKDVYDEIGVDINNLQKSYIKGAGIKMFIYILMADGPWVIIILISAFFAAGVSRDLRNDIFKKVSSFSKFDIDTLSVSSLITRATGDVIQIENFLFYSLETVFFTPIVGSIAFKRACDINVGMSWIIVLVVVILSVLFAISLRLIIPKQNLTQKLLDNINLVTRENLTGLLSVRAFNTQKFEEERFNGINKKLLKNNLFIERMMAFMNPIILLITNLSIVAILWVSKGYVSSNSLQIGEVVTYINYMTFVITSFLMLSMTIVELPRTIVSTKRILEVLNTKSSVSDNKNLVKKNDFNGELKFNNVSFSYPDAPAEYVLKDISFSARPGEVTAIIGGTGSGKSTIASLVLRFYDVSSGEILIDGENIKNISMHDLRDQISFAPQNGALFKGTIESNIKYGNNNASDEELKEVAEIAQAKKFISEKPEGFLHEVAQRGSNISGGQKQRLSIARAIMKNSKIYIFDDSFSALDYKTDLELRRCLRSYIKDKTTIIVAQRISTIIDADQILVLNEGRLVGQGRHEELMKNCPEYYEMAVNQLPESML